MEFSVSNLLQRSARCLATLDRLAASPDLDISTTAQLALGAVAAKLNPVQAKAIIDRFVQSLQSVTQIDEQRHLLLILGNVGTTELLPILEPFTQHQNAVLRVAAATSLRKIPNPRVDQILVGLLGKDTDDSVRLETAVALSSREMTPESFNAQKAVFTKESAVKIKLVLLNNLWQVRQTYPEAIAIVKNTAEKDTNKDVKEAAEKLLAEP